MKEIEVKFEIGDIEVIRSRISGLGAEYKGKSSQKDLWVDTPDDKLKKEGKGLRLRLQDEKATLTLKDKQISGPSIREAEETEIQVDDFNKTREILERLGFVEVLLLEKKRERWKVGNLDVLLDEVRDLGIFLELEGSREEIEKAITNLGLEKAQRVTEHYGQIYEKHIGSR